MPLIRSASNPIITREQVVSEHPYLKDVSSVFNPGAIQLNGKTYLLLRVQDRGRRTHLMSAVSDYYTDFTVHPEPIVFKGIEGVSDTIYHIYDPRLTTIDGIIYCVFAIDTEKGCFLGLAEGESLEDMVFKGIISDDDCRNGVLFPEKINGLYCRLDRPNKVATEGGPLTGNSICYSTSEDLVHWERKEAVISGRPHYWDELIGSGPPPIKTREGWLHIYHGVATHFASSNIYQTGVVLLDLEKPWKVIARGSMNILEPRELWELMGQVPNVVFPSGIIVEGYDDEGFAKFDSIVHVYYGAADTCVGHATTTIKELITDCYC